MKNATVEGLKKDQNVLPKKQFDAFVKHLKANVDKDWKIPVALFSCLKEKK